MLVSLRAGSARRAHRGASDRLRRAAQGRDAGGLVGGWAGGEKELKDWAAVPFSPIDPALRKAMNDFSEKKEGAVSGTLHARLRALRALRLAGAHHRLTRAPRTASMVRGAVRQAAGRAGADAAAAAVGKGRFVKGDPRQYPVRRGR